MNDHCVLYHLYSDPNALIEGAKHKLPSSTFRCAFEQGILYVQYICTYITGVGPYGYAARWGRLRCSGSTELSDLFYSSVESSEQWAMSSEQWAQRRFQSKSLTPWLICNYPWILNAAIFPFLDYCIKLLIEAQEPRDVAWPWNLRRKQESTTHQCCFTPNSPIRADLSCLKNGNVDVSRRSTTAADRQRTVARWSILSHH